MKVGDSVILTGTVCDWPRIGLVLGWSTTGFVLVFWGEDFPCEEEYHHQLVMI